MSWLPIADDVRGTAARVRVSASPADPRPAAVTAATAASGRAALVLPQPLHLQGRTTELPSYVMYIAQWVGHTDRGPGGGGGGGVFDRLALVVFAGERERERERERWVGELTEERERERRGCAGEPGRSKRVKRRRN